MGRMRGHHQRAAVALFGITDFYDLCTRNAGSGGLVDMLTARRTAVGVFGRNKCNRRRALQGSRRSGSEMPAAISPA